MKLGFKSSTSNTYAKTAGSIRQRASRLIRDTTFALEADIKARAPVDTGTLRRSYHAEMQDDLHGVVGTDLEYAPFVERGTRYQAAQPHVTPAFDAMRPRFNAEMEEIFR